MQLNTYLNYPGTCAQAFRYYEQHLGAQITMMMTHGQMPGGGAPPEMADAVLHARIRIGGVEVFASDVAGEKCEPVRSSYLALNVTGSEEADRVYAALADGGETFMPPQETFFAHKYAVLRDRFGVLWMIVYAKPMGAPPA